MMQFFSISDSNIEYSLPGQYYFTMRTFLHSSLLDTFIGMRVCKGPEAELNLATVQIDNVYSIIGITCLRALNCILLAIAY